MLKQEMPYNLGSNADCHTESEPHATHDSVTSDPRLGVYEDLRVKAFNSHPRRR